MKAIQKKRLIAIIGVFMFVLMGTGRTFGQSYSQSMLINKEWVYQIPEKPSFYFTVSFTNTEEIVALYVKGVKSDAEEVKRSYYLSNEIVDTFRSDLIGKSKGGKYIVALNKPKIGEQRLELYEIIELTDTTLRIRIRGIQRDEIIELKAK